MTSEVRISSNMSDAGRWELASRSPHPLLRGHVLGYAGLKSAMRVVSERHLPSGEAALVVNLGRPHRIVDSRDTTQSLRFRDVAVMGVHDRHFVTESDGTKHLVVVRLTPPGARQLFGAPMQDIVNRWAHLDDVDRALARRIAEPVRDLASWSAVFEFLDRAILERLSEKRLDRAFPAWDIVRNSGGRTSIGALTSRLDVGYKHLLAQFREHVGVTPKATAEIIRFNRLLRKLRGGCQVNWAAVAHESGYYDQAHMIREFKAFAGGTPSDIATKVAGFTLDERAAGAA